MIFFCRRFLFCKSVLYTKSVTEESTRDGGHLVYKKGGLDFIPLCLNKYVSTHRKVSKHDVVDYVDCPSVVRKL